MKFAQGGTNRRGTWQNTEAYGGNSRGFHGRWLDAADKVKGLRHPVAVTG